MCLGTVHIFKLNNGGSSGSIVSKQSGHHQGGSGAAGGSSSSRQHGGSHGSSGKDDNAKSTLRFMKGILPKYFSSEWSFAQFRIPGYSKANAGMKVICAFGAEENTLLTITADGKFLKCNFARGGDCVMESYAMFTNNEASVGSASSSSGQGGQSVTSAR